MGYRFICYGTLDNLHKSFEHGFVGSNNRYMLNLKQDDTIIFYIKGFLYGYGKVVKSLTSNELIFEGGIYPFRAKLKDIIQFKEPFNFKESKSYKSIFSRFPRSWCGKYLNHPQELPEDIGKMLFEELKNHKID